MYAKFSRQTYPTWKLSCDIAMKEEHQQTLGRASTETFGHITKTPFEGQFNPGMHFVSIKVPVFVFFKIQNPPTTQ